MKNFASKHPYATGILAFALIAVGGSILGLIVGILIVVTDTTQPNILNDPHDGTAMASGMIESLITMASLFLGLLAGLTTTFYLKSKQNRSAREKGTKIFS